MTFDGTDDFISTTTLPVSDYPFTFAAWIRPSSIATLMHIIGLYASANEDNRCALWIAQTTGTLVQNVDNDSGGNNAITANAVNVGAWNHVVCRFNSATSRGVTLNGGTEATSATSRIYPPGIDTLVIGKSGNSGGGGLFSGQIMWPAVWNAAIGADGRSALAAGWHPSEIRTGTLVFFGDVLFPTARDLHGASLSLTGGAATSEGPPVSW